MSTDETPTETVAVILARMEVKLDHSLSQVGDHEARIRVLEKKVWAASGVAALIGSVGAAFLSKLIGG